MKILIFIPVFFLISCGRGSSSSSNPIDLEINTNTNSTYVYVPPPGKSIDNCVAKTNSSDFIENFTNEQLNLSIWSYYYILHHKTI